MRAQLIDALSASARLRTVVSFLMDFRCYLDEFKCRDLNLSVSVIGMEKPNSHTKHCRIPIMTEAQPQNGTGCQSGSDSRNQHL
jgi:hypothetical protein